MGGSKTPVGWLRVFEVAARHLSFSAAAEELRVTPSAVSQQVRLLEHRLGRALFQRLPRGLRLTGAGEALVPVCRESFERLDAALLELFGDRKGGRLVIRVAAGFARHWLLPRLADFSTRYPEIPLRIAASIWAGEPLDPNVEIDIRLGSAPIQGMACFQLTEDELFPVCSPSILRARKPPDLLTVPLLHTIGFAQGWSDWLEMAGIERHASERDIEFDSVLLSLEMAALGHGVALGRTSFAEDLLREKRLVAPFKLRLKTTDNVYLVHPPGLAPRSPAGIFKDWLLSMAQKRARRPQGM
ncbi:LysR substrate-binding domain-containing protein [Dongia deserti]|uniref:LysR substrate-binding domain-containing protein n=1 Tax=Dongia deserti TaxID=2268030 RepID=UPI000E646E9B|nr:LysR substrate-binding domain-containing protein [Dongia deserti]